MGHRTIRNALLVAGIALGTPAAGAAEMASAEMLSNACAACHGPAGNSEGPAIPSIAGLSKNYFIAAMLAYKYDNDEAAIEKVVAANPSVLEADEFEALQKRMGYRFVLRRLVLPETLEAGKMFPVSMWWVNKGVAPVYGEYLLALELRSAAGSAMVLTSADVREWLPGDAVYDDTLHAPPSLKPGQYDLRLALLDPTSRKPAIRLAIEGRQDDGWYALGRIGIR